MNEFEKLMNTIEYLEAQIEQLEEDAMSPEAGEDRTNIWQEIDNLNKQLEENNANLKEAMKEIIDNEIQIDRLSTSIENARRTIEILEEDAMSPEAGEDRTNIYQEIDDLNRQIEKWQEQLSKLPKRLADRAQNLDNQIANAERTIEILEEDAMSPEAGEDRTNIYQQIDDLNKQIEAWKKELESIKRLIKFVDKYRGEKTQIKSERKDDSKEGATVDTKKEPEENSTTKTAGETKKEPEENSTSQTASKTKREPVTATKSQNGEKVYDWHPELTDEQVDELRAEGIEPGDPEYFLALRNYGIRDDGPFHYHPEDDLGQGKEEAEKQGKKVYDWHPELTPEQKEELIAEGLEPGDPEYFLALRNYGIKDDGPFHYEDDPNKGKGKDPNPGKGKGNGEEPEPDPGPGKGKGKDPVPPGPGKDPKPGTAIAKSGLQIFREQFNQMPDIEDKHTLSERLPALQAIGGAAGIGLLAVNPFIGVPVAAASILSKSIAYRLTGQKKLEEQIEQQFLDMKSDEFDKMVDFLSEEKIQDIKPNAVILRSLHKAMLKVSKERAQNLETESNELKEERNTLIGKESLTPEEEARLGNINTRLIEIEEVETPKVQTRLKEVKRGKDRVSMQYKGNLATRFNIFAHRNTRSEDYKEPINELADAELERDTARAEGRVKDAGVAGKKMDDVMEKYTSTNGLGIQNSIFNKRQSIVRFMSDRVDNALKFAAMITTAGIGTAVSISKLNEFKVAQEANAAEHQGVVNQYNNAANTMQTAKTASAQVMDKNLAQKLSDGQVNQVATMGETATLHTTGSTSHPNYISLDHTTNQDVVNAANNATISGKNPEEYLKQLAGGLRKDSMPVAQRLENAANAASGNTWKADHTVQLDMQGRTTEQVEAQATLYENVAALMEKINNAPALQTISNNFKTVKQSFIGPIIAAMGAGLGIGHDASKNRQEKAHNQAVDISIEEIDDEGR